MLNVKAGGYLPSKIEGKWRYCCPLNLKGLALAGSVYSNDSNEINSKPNVSHSVLDSQEQFESNTKASEYSPEALANNRLHKAVIKVGLLQYPLVLVSVISFLGLILISKSSTDKVWLFISLMMTITAGFFMLYRAYFSSLGW
ncbi:MAG TPA: hypothetical protein PKB02_04125 [Anaerohalosphaeraceae bacterium]|nr:hypothetical protein [Anaerohalosphaeraceae bacterium]